MSAGARRRFEDKVVLVVGAAQGVGLATARSFAAEGAKLSLADVSPALDDAAASLVGADVLATRADVTDADSVQALIDATIARFGRIDVLAHVAGVLQQTAKVADLSGDEWDRVLTVNAKGPMHTARAVIPHMREQGGGRIVNVASWFSYSGHAYFGAYCASKAALRILTQAIADEEAGANITANCVSPGNVDTEMHRKALRDEAVERGISADEMKDIEWAKIPLKHACPPEDIADAILFLASDDAKYMTGASVDVNGGVLLR